MPLKFWDEAFIAATYLINRIPTKLLNYSTPLETLFHEKPDYSALRIFGCACWPNLRPYNTRKLEFRSKRCAFVGYSNFHKGFKCLDISTGRVYISRDVVFDESVFPFSELHPNAGVLLRSEILLLPPELLNASGTTTVPDHMHHCSTNPSDHAAAPPEISGTFDVPNISFGSLPMFMMSFSQIPNGVLKNLDHFRSTFFLARIF
jgi:histone deacetylase 1/2